MLFIIKYFWFLCVPIGLIQAIIFNRRASVGVKPNSPEQDEISRLTKGYFLWFSMPGLIMGLLQLLGGHQHPFFVFSLEFRDPTILAAWVTIIFLWFALLRWVWLGTGAETITRYSRAFNAPSNETGVKLLCTLCVVGGAAALIVGSFIGIPEELEKSIQPTQPIPLVGSDESNGSRKN